MLPVTWSAVLAASYVFLLEPSLNVAVEQQALARVHRFGQTRPVRIVRFICHETVEVSPASGCPIGYRLCDTLSGQQLRCLAMLSSSGAQDYFLPWQ